MTKNNEERLQSEGLSFNRRNFIAGAFAAGLTVSALPLEAATLRPHGSTGISSKTSNSASMPDWIKAQQFQPPLRAGFTRVFDPSEGETQSWYINDHCFIRDDSGTWHLFGITGRNPAVPSRETYFLHATARDLMGPWTKHAPVMHADRAAGETVMWAPYIMKHDGLYWMFYCGGGATDEKYQINLATSSDLWTWKRSSANPLVVDGYDARDPVVMRHGSQWILYYCATEHPTGGHHVVKAVISSDLLHWANPRIVFRSPVVGTFGGPTESPFVLERDSRYYLFVCTNTPYNNTDVYVSDSPFHWEPEDVVLRVGAHAAEVVDAGDGKWFVSSAGWGQGGLYLSSLTWESPGGW